MKWFSVFLACALLASFNACEKHPASQLILLEPKAEVPEHGTSTEPKAAGHSDAQPSVGTAPKYFPEKK